MKIFNLTLLIIMFSIASNCKAQNYGTCKYWGKEYKLDRKFIEVLNENWNSFIVGTAPKLNYYDGADYQAIYSKIVDNLTNSSFIIIVTEANQLQWLNAVGILPGTDGEKDRSKKSSTRASLVLYQVVPPALKQFVQYKDYHLD
jgi:hypothetical protein